MTLEEWLKGGDLDLSEARHLRYVTEDDIYRDCCWRDDNGEWWGIEVLPDGTAITYCDS